MTKIYFLILLTFFSLLLFPSSGYTEKTEPVISIGGAVQSPLGFTMSDLAHFRQVSIFTNNTNDKSINKNAVKYTGVTLRTLLELVKIQKYEFEESSKIDNNIPAIWRVKNAGKIQILNNIALSIKNSEGKQVVLSWGEIFLQDENSIIVALQSGTQSPAKTKSQNLSMPVLVFKNDQNKNRLLSNVCSIDVLCTRATDEKELKDNQPYILTANNEKYLLSDAISTSKNTSTTSTDKKLSYNGVSLLTIIDKFFPGKLNNTSIIKIISKQGELSVISYGELLTEKGRQIILTDGKSADSHIYGVIFSGDNSQYRWNEDIHHIEITDLKQKGGIFVVGVGCGDTCLLTNEAISYMVRADAFICMEGYEKSMAGYIAGKPVLFDPFMQLGKFYKKKHPEISDEEAEKTAKEIYKRDMDMIRKSLDENKIIVLLEPGDPTLFGGWRNWLSPNFPKETIKVVTGISSFNVANSMLGDINLTNGSVIIAEPETLKINDSLIQSAAKSGDVLVIFMGLGRMKSLMPQFNKYYAKDTPVYLIYYAGIAEKERKIKTSLERIVEEINSNNENFLGLIYIGKNLETAQDSENTRKFISDK